MDTTKDLIELIEFMNKSKLDGTYKAAILKTAAAHFESLVQAESMEAIIMTSLNKLR